MPSTEKAEAAAARYGSIHQRWAGLRSRGPAAGASVTVTPILDVAALPAAPALDETELGEVHGHRRPFKTLVGVPVPELPRLDPSVAVEKSDPATAGPNADRDRSEERSEQPAVAAEDAPLASPVEEDASRHLVPRREKVRWWWVGLAAGIAGALAWTISVPSRRHPHGAESAAEHVEHATPPPAKPEAPARTQAVSHSSVTASATRSERRAGSSDNAASQQPMPPRTSSDVRAKAENSPVRKAAPRAKAPAGRQKPPRRRVRDGIIRQNPF